MFWTIARKEILASLLTFRFGIGLVLCIVAVAAGTLSVIEDYESRKQAYQRATRDYEKTLAEEKPLAQKLYKVFAFRTPRQLAVFSVGSDRWQGNQVHVTHHRVPYEAFWLGDANPYMAVFRSIDLTLIIQVILGLLALLFAHDAVSGEREEGTLRLMLANPVARDLVLFGKAAGHLCVLGLILSFSYLLCLLFVLVSPTLALDGGELSRVAVMFAVSLLYVGAMYAGGLLLSTLTRRSATALVWAVAAWICSVAIWPNGVAYGVDRLLPIRAAYKSAEAASSQINALFGDEINALTERVTGSTWPNFGWSTSSSGYTNVRGYLVGGFRTQEAIDGANDSRRKNGLPVHHMDPIAPAELAAKVAQFGALFRQGERLRIEFAERQWDEAWAPLEAQRRDASGLATGLAMLSPAGAYAEATAILAGTDRDDYWRFLAETRRYRQGLIAHYEEQKYFGSREWFNFDVDAPSLDGLPRFRDRGESLAASLGRAAPQLVVLGVFALAGFAGAYVRFRRYEV